MSSATHSMALRPRKSQITSFLGMRKRMRPDAPQRAHQLVSANAPFVATRLPPELLLMVVDHYPQIPPVEVIIYAYSLPLVWRERHNVLRALSQTCRAMRALFLPMLYEEVEACIEEDLSIPVAKFVSYILRQQCLGLLRTPALAVHVVVMTVSLLHSPAHPSLKPFAKCLAALPNLCYLRIVACDFDTNILTSEFQKRSYPSVMSVIMPGSAHPLLLALPGVVEIIAKNGSDDAIPKTAAKNCHKVDAIMGLLPWPRETSELVAQSMPGLQTIGLVVPLTMGAWGIEPYVVAELSHITHLAALPNLTELMVQVLPDCMLTSAEFESRLAVVRVVSRRVLQRQSHGRPKTLIVRILSDPIKEERYSVV